MQQILTHLSAHEAQYVDELCEYVRFPSVSAQPQHQADLVACAEWLAQRCRRAGLEARVCPTAGHPVVWAQTPRRAPGSGSGTSRTSRPHFVIYGHYDVQPAEPLDLWKTPPFEPRLEKGALFARGVWHGDIIPPVPDIVPGSTTLDLSYMQMGHGPHGPSWLARTIALRNHHGPFRLAFLETLLRAADARASAMVSPSGRAPIPKPAATPS